MEGTGAGTVLLAPGFTGSKEDFLDLLPLLRDWTVIALDHRGQYESPRAQEYSLRLWADDLCRIAQSCQPPVHLVGHSLGGLIAGTASSGFDWTTVVFLNSGSGPIHQSKHDQLRLLIVSPGLPAAEFNNGRIGYHLTLAEALDAALAHRPAARGASHCRCSIGVLTHGGSTFPVPAGA